MNPNELPSRNFAVLGAIDPDAQSASTVSTPWLPVVDFHAFAALVMAGSLGTNATLDAKVEQAQDNSGTGAKDIDGKAITQMTEAGGDSDKQSVIEFLQSDLDVGNAYTHVRLSVTVAVATSDVGAALLGFAARYAPASDADAASVSEIAA